MATDFKEIRRQNRILEDQSRVCELLHISEYGFLSLGSTENGYAYGIPLSYVYDKEMDCLYFHCALEGQKLDIMNENDKVSFCVVGTTQAIPNQFTTLYESVIAFGTVDLNLSDDEKRKALRLIVQKYSEGHEESGDTYMNKSWARTMTFKIKIEHKTAKAKYK